MDIAPHPATFLPATIKGLLTAPRCYASADAEVYWDMETTGLNPYHCHMVQLAAVKVFPDGTATVFNRFIRAPDGVRFDKKVALILGYVESDLVSHRQAVSIEMALREFVDFVGSGSGNPILFAHAGQRMDVKVLRRCLRKHLREEVPVGWTFFDTLDLAQHGLPHAGSHSLSELKRRYRVRPTFSSYALGWKEHDAFCDACDLMHVLSAMVRDIGVPLDSLLAATGQI